MVKYAPRKVYIRESGGYVELSYTEFCRCRESDQTYMDKLFIPIQGCLLEVVREQCKQRPTTAGFAEQNGRNAKLNGQGSF